MSTAVSVRPTKKQKELLTYIERFISEHGYSPSYREIMNGLRYTSVATVALHVNSLIKRGHLRKRDRSARSLEVVEELTKLSMLEPKQTENNEAEWLVSRVDNYFHRAEKNHALKSAELDQLYVLIGALKVLGFDEATEAFIPRLSLLKGKISHT